MHSKVFAMTDAANKPSLLEQLRARSDAVREQDTAARRPTRDDYREIDRRLATAYRWLEEALGHLDVIRPVIAHRFLIEPVLTIASPRYERGFVSLRRHTYAGLELIEHIEMFYRMALAEPIRVKVQTGAALAIDDRLRAAQLEFQYQVHHDEARGQKWGLFTIKPAVTATVRLVPNYRHQVVEATLQNIDRLETVTLDFQPEAISETAMEDLVQFMLGEPNGFLKRAPLADVGAKRAAPGDEPTITMSRYGVASK
jgi:hypothetical protein